MKTLAKFMWLMILGMIVMNFVACSTDDDDYGAGFYYNEKPDTTPKDTTNNKPTPDPTPTPEPKDSISIDWSADMEKTFGYSNGQWPSTITIHYTDGKDTTFRANLPMTTRIEAPAEILVASDAPETRFSSLDTTVSIDSTEWTRNDADGYYYRTITRRQVGHMNNYDFVIVSSHAEAYMLKEGKVVYFKHGQEATPTRWNDQPKAAGNDVQKGDKTYTVENAFICMQHKLHASKTEYPEATTRVLREKVEEKEPETPVVTTMPTPDLKVSTYGLVNNITFSPEFKGNNVVWHKVCLTRNTINGKECFSIWVDGSFVCTVELKSNEQNQKYNSAYLVEGVWVPAILKYSTANDGGWDYSFVVNGSGKMKTIDQNMALASGLSNFKKDNNAAQTPSVYTTTSVEEYGTKKLVTVNGYDKDMKPVIKFTIGECL